MESPRKFNDCYFYYYSTCTKGDNCVFRHEPSALGCETMCTAWQQGKCLDKRCKLRHMELRKNRKQIPCYWENQPGGCRKKHCPFMHKNPDARTDGIAPSQPCQPQPAGAPVCGVEPPTEQAPAPQPAPVPLLWQQQRQVPTVPGVVLDSAILGVLPGVGGVGGPEMLTRRVHPHDATPYSMPTMPSLPTLPSMPVDPLVVNFDEESDSESAPSSTPTKQTTEEQRIARTKSQELLLLEQIQAEAAAYYSYDSLHVEPKERKISRTNLNTKYDRMSLDEIAGKKQPTTEDRRSSLDFKVLSLDEIRARKKQETVIQTPPQITLNLNRKRKLSTHEVNTTTGNKIIKVVRSNSIVYKKVDPNIPPTANQGKSDGKSTAEEADNRRKRTLSELSDIYDPQEDELEDNCYEFKKIKLAQETTKPRLVMNNIKDTINTIEKVVNVSNVMDNNDSDSEVQIVSVDIAENTNFLLSDSDVIDLFENRLGEPIDIVDLSDDLDESDVVETSLDQDLAKNIPDVVASCQKKTDVPDSDLLNEIDCILDDDDDL